MTKIINLKINKDCRGELIAIESSKDIPFDIKRIYYLFNSPKDQVRARHAHKNLTQLYIAVSGSCTILTDDGENKKTITLDKPNIGLLFDKTIWREVVDFSKDCVLLILADDFFKEEDYIRDYEEFIKYISEK